LTRVARIKAEAKALIPRERRLLKWSLFGAVLAIGLTVDLVLKHIAESRLLMGESHEVLPFLSLQLTHNDGVAFGMLGGNSTLILVANVIALFVLLAYVLMERRPVLAGIGGGAIVGGSLGNMIQRIMGDGHVTDFLKFPHWPNFNVADVLIDAGLAAVLIGMVMEVIKAWRSKKHEAASSG
jgi:signal peptidase II